MTEDVIVTVRHKTRLKMCNRGVRPWMNSQVVDGVQLSWKQFLETGYPASVLRKTGDPFAIRVCELAEKEAASGE